MMKRIISFLMCLGAACLVLPAASAHVKWFTEIEPERISIDAILDPFFVCAALVCALAIGVGYQYIPKLNQTALIRKFDLTMDRYRSYTPLILQYGLAAALLVQLLQSEAIFAPELARTDTGTVLSWIVIGLLLIPYHYLTKAGALLLLYLFFDRVAEYGVFHMLDYAFYVAIAFVLLVQKTPYKKWGFPLLYLITGLSLCWVAVEKWVYPNTANDIIVHYNVPTFGFSPDLFISMTAFIEFLVGYLLVVGVLNRILALVLTLIFITTAMLFGAKEVVGHFMIHIVLILFIIEGTSFYNPPIKMHKTTTDQVVFVSLNFIFALALILLIHYRFG